MNRVNLDYMVALAAVQPATARLVAITIDQADATAAGALVRLVSLGLATRSKPDPLADAPLTDWEKVAQRRWKNGLAPLRGGDDTAPWRPPSGKRPYLYQLTPAATIAAGHLCEAFQILEQRNDDNDQQQTG